MKEVLSIWYPRRRDWVDYAQWMLVVYMATFLTLEHI